MWDSSELGMRVLMWLHLATRPLKINEIQHALAVELGNIALDEDNLPTRQRWFGCCLGLVFVDDETSTVRFVHYTLEDYFQRYGSSLFPHGHSMAAEICLTYLNFGELSVECSSNIGMGQLLTIFPFLEYAACTWGYYTAKCRSGVAEALEINVLGSKDKRLPHVALQILYFYINGLGDRLSYGGEQYHGRSLKFLGIHAAAHFGTHEINFWKNHGQRDNQDTPERTDKTTSKTARAATT